MNARERFLAVMSFETPDRNLSWEMGYWPETLERWYREGLERRRNGRGQPGAGIRGEAAAHDETSSTRVREQDVRDRLGLDPNLIKGMMAFLADFWIALWDQALDVVEADCAHFWEDMAYRNGPMISPAMFREFMAPCYRRIIGFLTERDIKMMLVDPDGNLDRLIPLFLEAGLTGVWPIEVQAGNDLLEIRRHYPRLQLQGGIDKLQVAGGREAIDRELQAKVPFMLERGGYIPHLDHVAHPEISWADFRYHRRRLRELIEQAAARRTRPGRGAAGRAVESSA